MATTQLTLRSTTSAIPGHTVKGIPLTNAEVDTNFINIDARINAEIELLAPKANPTFTGSATFAAISVPDQVAGNNTGAAANTKFVTAAVAGISSQTITTQLGFTPEPAFTTLPISKGGTGATSAAAALTALGAEPSITTLPISKGGTGATSATDARTALGIDQAISAALSTNGGVVSSTGAQTLTDKTLTAPVINTPVINNMKINTRLYFLTGA